MHAYELLPRLTYLTLTASVEGEDWAERLEFIGDMKRWQMAGIMEEELST